MFRSFSALFILLFLGISHLRADECRGKVDVAPAYVHLDILEHGRTVKSMDMGAVKVDGNIMIYKGTGWVLKPSMLYAHGGGDLFGASLGFGHCTPITEYITLTPSVGGTYTHVRTRIDIPFLEMKHLLEKFHSFSGYIALEATIKLYPGWRVCGSYQYAWSRSHTTIDPIFSGSSKAEGPNYGLMLEYDVADMWTLQLGGAYNISLSKEKHGLRGAGVKLGIAHWF